MKPQFIPPNGGSGRRAEVRADIRFCQKPPSCLKLPDHTENYRLDGLDPTIRASRLYVLDLAATKQLRGWVDFKFDIDNLTDKVYYETQDYRVSHQPLQSLPGFMAHQDSNRAYDWPKLLPLE